MDIDQTETINQPTYNQPSLNQTQKPRNIESQYTPSLGNPIPKPDPPIQQLSTHGQNHPESLNPLPYPPEPFPSKALELSNPSNLVGLSKAQLKVLAWVAFYNEAEESMYKKPKGIRYVEEITEVDPGPIALSQKPIETFQQGTRGKRKGEVMDGPASNKALKLSKIGPGDIEKVDWVNSGSINEERQRSKTPIEPERDMEK